MNCHPTHYNTLAEALKSLGDDVYRAWPNVHVGYGERVLVKCCGKLMVVRRNHEGLYHGVEAYNCGPCALLIRRYRTARPDASSVF